MSLFEQYQKKVVPALMRDFFLSNALSVPKISKIVVNVGLGEAVENKKVLETFARQISLISGQKPIECTAKRSISAFKLRAGTKIGLKVTLRGKRMYDFLEKLISIVLPRVRDFRGIPHSAFDGGGNLNIGLTELLVFPEVNFENLDKIRGCEITIVTTAKDDIRGKLLLEKLGFPFVKQK